MNQSPSLYATASALSAIEPWLTQHLPTLDPAARRHFIQLVTGIVEHHSLLLADIAASSAFQAMPASNFTQVQRIIQDARLTQEQVLFPLVRQLLAIVPAPELYLTMDQTNHTTLFTIIQVGWATDGISLPLGFLLYPTNGAWADATRTFLAQLDTVIPDHFRVILLADRVHTGEPFLTCLDALGWDYVFRAAEDTLIADGEHDWVPLKQLRQRHGRMRAFRNVRVWKTSRHRTNVCLYRHQKTDGTITVWYVVTSLDPTQERFVEYAARWWQECTYKLLKSGFFAWERTRVQKPARALVVLMGFGAACWILWLLGREHEHIPKTTVATTRSRPRRRNLIKWGWEMLTWMRKRQQVAVLPPPPPPRVQSYQRRFPGHRLPARVDELATELW